MKYLIIALMLPTTTMAQTAEDVETCASLGNSAKMIMEIRQGGTPQSELLELLEDAPLSHSIINEAYEERRWHTESSQVRAAEDFRDLYERSCFEALK